MKKILIVEEYGIVRVAITYLMQFVFREVDVRVASSMDEVIEHLHNTIFHLLVFNIRFPLKHSMRMVRIIKAMQPETPVLFLSAAGPTLTFPYLNSNVDLYLKKEIDPVEIVPAIQAMNKHGRNNTSSSASSFVRDVFVANEVDWAIARLSEREKEIMGLLAKGLRPSQIKKLLNIQYTTISTLKARMFYKMQVSSVLQLFKKLQITDHYST